MGHGLPKLTSKPRVFSQVGNVELNGINISLQAFLEPLCCMHLVMCIVTSQREARVRNVSHSYLIME